MDDDEDDFIGVDGDPAEIFLVVLLINAQLVLTVAAVLEEVAEVVGAVHLDLRDVWQWPEMMTFLLLLWKKKLAMMMMKMITVAKTS